MESTLGLNIIVFVSATFCETYNKIRPELLMDTGMSLEKYYMHSFSRNFFIHSFSPSDSKISFCFSYFSFCRKSQA